MVTREAVVWAYRLLLNREPESEQIITEHQEAVDISALSQRFLRSDEYLLANTDDSERALFEKFIDRNAIPQLGFVTDFLGTRIRTSSLWDAAKALDGKLLGVPIPGDFHAATIEWVGLLSSVSTANDRYRAMELGAGYGPWVIAGGKAAERRGISDIKLCAVEASPQRYDTLLQHFRDNGFSPPEHILLNAAVGTANGEAIWPIPAEPLNDQGPRPIENGACQDYRGVTVDKICKVPMVELAELVQLELHWDMIHIDIQGHEFDVCQSCIDELAKRVHWLVIGTHSRKIEGQLVDLLYDDGWVLERETPCTFRFGVTIPTTLEALITVDGTQVWHNRRLD